MFLESRDKSLNMLNLSEPSKKKKEQKKNKGSVLVAESAYNAQNTQFGLVMIKRINRTIPHLIDLGRRKYNIFIS